MAPLPKDRMYGLLGELYLRTARRNENDVEKEALFRLYARELSAYPGDITADAITRYRGKFFPALSELQDAITRDERLRERRLKIEALRKFLAGEQSERTGPPPTPEQIAKAEAHFGINQPPERQEPDPFWTVERQEAFRKKYGLKAPATQG